MSFADLLDGDADSHGVDGAFDQNFLLVVPADDHRLEEQLFTAPRGRNRVGEGHTTYLLPQSQTTATQGDTQASHSPYFHLWLVVSLHHL